MKKIFTLIITAIVVVSVSYAQAPPPRHPHPGGPQQQQTPQMQNLQEVKTNAFIEILNLSKSQIEDFTELYVAYDSEMNDAAATYSPAISQLNRVDRSTVSYDQVNDVIQAQIDLAQALIDIKSKYLKLFSKVLSPSQTLGLFQQENMIRTKIQDEQKRRSRQE